MSFGTSCRVVPCEVIFGTCEGARVSRENWEVNPEVILQHNEAQKRRKSTSVSVKKRAKMTRGDDKIIDETAKDAAKNLLDQIQDTPGRISLKLDSPQAAGVCPLPSNLDQAVASEWEIDNIKEGQLTSLLTENTSLFKPLGIQKIQKGIIDRQLLPRQMSLKEAFLILKNEDQRSDQYVEFAIAVANVLRRCDAETAYVCFIQPKNILSRFRQKITQSVTETFEKVGQL
ncbi:hypothetical protein CAEBREN_11432 [Caenorhabditis brenneri]|uniref:Uncharacterized protein n=1 Tax=Caenorhabditis brenneri TaxID=135651 RepID=G0MVN7_CAEBE|nr:hypothetical protein CAEBREN_11432 [Caenorhabditis brenneri]